MDCEKNFSSSEYANNTHNINTCLSVSSDAAPKAFKDIAVGIHIKIITRNTLDVNISRVIIFYKRSKEGTKSSQ